MSTAVVPAPSSPGSTRSTPVVPNVSVDSMPDASPAERVMALAAGVGPILLAAGSVAWLAGDGYAELRGILMFWAVSALMLAGLGLVSRFEDHAPRARAVLTATLAIGAVAGGAFANEVNMVEHFGVERLIDQDTPSAMLSLGLPGLLFPISMVTIGVLSFRFRTMPRAQAALLTVAMACFPLSRIPEIPELAVAADLVLVAALAPTAIRAIRR